MACHAANMAFLGLNLTLPIRVRAEATDVNPETCPSSAHVVMEFPARGELPPVAFHWFEGQRDGKKLAPPADLVARVLAADPDEKRRAKLADTGSILVGRKGFLYFPHGGGHGVLGPAKDFEGVNVTKPETLPVNGNGDQGHKGEWVAAIRAGRPEAALSNFGYGSVLTESFLLGNVAIRTQSAFEYDPAAGKVRGDRAAEQYLAANYRKGWELPGVG
jgi:hypothetical protein